MMIRDVLTKLPAVAYKAKVYAYWATWDETQWNNVIAMVNSLETGLWTWFG